MEKKFIKIEWDEVEVIVTHTNGLKTAELFGVLETAKLYLWEHKTNVED